MQVRATTSIFNLHDLQLKLYRKMTYIANRYAPARFNDEPDFSQKVAQKS